MISEQVKNDIQEIIDNFDWVKVVETMSALNWKWAGQASVPNIHQLQVTAESLLASAALAVIKNTKKKASVVIGTGGFEAQAQKFKDSDKIYLSLKFIVSDWSNYE